MPELGFAVYLLAISYGVGVLWYTLLGSRDSGWMRMAAFPLLGVVIGEAIWNKYLSAGMGQGLAFGGLHVYVVLVSSFIAVLVDMFVAWIAKEHSIAHLLHLPEHRQGQTG